MGSPGRRALIESLESRSLASADISVLSVSTKLTAARQSLYAGDGYSETTYSGVLTYVDSNSILNIRGTIGDDSILVRKLASGNIQIDTTTKTYANQLSSGSSGYQLLSTVSHVYEVSPTLFSSIRIDGGAGDDAVRVEGLTSNPKGYSIEFATVKQYQAADGQTPSDSIRTGKYSSTSYWATLAAEQLETANTSNAETVFFGDSHAARFATVGSATWNALFPNALNLGIAGDSTRQMITRVEDGLFDTLKPETLIVSVGTNNFNDPTTGGTDAQIYRGVLKLVHLLQDKLPNTRIILIGLGPRIDLGVTGRILALNARLARSAANNGYEFVSIYDRFTTASDAAKLADNTSHFTRRGYQALGAMLDALLNGDA